MNGANFYTDPNARCEQCGGPVVPDGEPEPYIGQLYHCVPCLKRLLQASIEAERRGEVYDAKDVFAHLRGGPKPVMKKDKPGWKPPERRADA